MGGVCAARDGRGLQVALQGNLLAGVRRARAVEGVGRRRRARRGVRTRDTDTRRLLLQPRHTDGGGPTRMSILARTPFGAVFQTEVLLNSKRVVPYVMLALFGANAWLWWAKGAANFYGWATNG